MKGSRTRDQPSGKKKPASSSDAKHPSARSGQQGRSSSKPSYKRRPVNNAALQRGRSQAKAGHTAQQASASAKLAGSHPTKRKVPISNWWGALIGLAAISYFIYQTITAGFNYISLFLTFAGLSLGAWSAVAWIAVQFVRLNWIIIIYLPAATTITLGFAAMSQSEPLLFFSAPMSAPHGACTGSPAGWIFHGFQPGQCAGVAFGRLGLLLAGGVATLVMVTINRSIKWRVSYLIDTGGRRRFMRNERRAWEHAHRAQARPQLDDIQREIAKLKSDLKTYPHGSEEAMRIRAELQQVRTEFGSKFRSLLHDIHIYREERRNERRQRRAQWQLKYWLRQCRGYGDDSNSIIPDSADPAKGRGSSRKARKPADKSLYQSSSPKELSRPRITNDPATRRSALSSYHAFRYCVEHWTKHYDIYVYIHQAAPKRIMKTAGRAALETVLNRGEAPNRIFIDSSGKIITKPITSDWDPS
jgi:hypothetical protein